MSDILLDSLAIWCEVCRQDSMMVPLLDQVKVAMWEIMLAIAWGTKLVLTLLVEVLGWTGYLQLGSLIM